MARGTDISWATSTWPITSGCAPQGPECDNCYAILQSWRMAHNPKIQGFEGTVHKTLFGEEVGVGEEGELSWTGNVFELPERLDWPLKWRNENIFASSLSDIFHPGISLAFLARAFKVMLDDDRGNQYLVLTKLPKRLAQVLRSPQFREICGGAWGEDIEPPEHIRFGVSIGVPKSLWRLKALAEIPAKYRFISMEPYLEEVEIPEQFAPYISQIIVGGEAAPRDKCRPMKPVWVDRQYGWCQQQGIPFWFKQWGNWTIRPPETINSKNVEVFWRERFYYRPKKETGNLLHGQVIEEPMRLARQ